jgi:hypothetical protein
MSWDKVPTNIRTLIYEAKDRPKNVENYKDFDTAMRTWNRWINKIEKTYGIKFDVIEEQGSHRFRAGDINEKQLMFAILKYT